MAISFVYEGVKKPRFKSKEVSNWLKYVILSYNKIPGNLTYIFCDDDYLLDINKNFLQHDFYTDIITFDYREDNIISGDLFISLDRVNENSLTYEVSKEDELLRVMVHGLFHLLGFGDKSIQEKKIIRELEDNSLTLFKNKGYGYIE